MMKRAIILLGLVVVMLSATLDAQVRRAAKKQRITALPKLEVEVWTGPDKKGLASVWSDSAAQTLRFYWSTSTGGVGSAEWAVSLDPAGKHLLAIGDAGKPTNGTASFAVDFRQIVGDRQPPVSYFVRVHPYKTQLEARAGSLRPAVKRKSGIVKAGAASGHALRPVEPPQLSDRPKAGPASTLVAVSIVEPGPGTEFTELGLRPELLWELPVEIDLETLTIGGDGSGEDPYLMVVVVYADGETVRPELVGANLTFPDSTVSLSSPSKTHENVPGGDSGDRLTIPRATGHFARTLRPIDAHSVARDFGLELTSTQERRVRENTLLGILVIGMEEDALPTTEVVNASRVELLSELQKEFERIIRAVEIPISGPNEFEMPDLVAAVQEVTGSIRKRLVESAKARTLEDLADYLVIPGFPTLILVPGIANQDDYIGYATAVFDYEQILQAGTSGLPIRLVLDQKFANDRAEDIFYTIEGRIRFR